MMTKVLLSETMDPHILVSGDVIGFQVDTLGLLCTSSANEPIPENEDRVSHLRVCTTHKKPSTADYRRCMFKIENDSGEKTSIVFGSTVKISHYPSDLVVVASNTEDDGYKDSKLKCVFLRSATNIPMDSLVHKWIITPRYKLREEGDSVRHNDYIILRNAQFKNLCLTSFFAQSNVNQVASSSFSDHFVGLCSTAMITTKPGLNILLLRKAQTQLETASLPSTGSSIGKGNGGVREGEDGMEQNVVISSDFVRIVHREYRGHLIARTDDEVEIQSSVIPLGSTNRKRADPAVDRNLGVFLRSFSDQQPREQLDFPAAYSSLGVWQVLSTDIATDSISIHSKLKFGTSVRLRHVITGQYLSVRPVVEEDTAKLKQFCTFTIPKQADNKEVSELNRPLGRERSRKQAFDEDSPDHGKPLDLPVSQELFLNRERGTADASLPFASSPLKMCLVALQADDLQSTDWSGKHRNSVHLSFTSGPDRTWEYRTGRSAATGNYCTWQLDRSDAGAYFALSEEALQKQQLKVTVFREHVVSGRTIIGEGKVQFSPMILQCEPDETVDTCVALQDPITGQSAGVVAIRFVANAVLTKEHVRALAQLPHREAGLLGLLEKFGRPHGPHGSDSGDDLKDSLAVEPAAATPDDDDEEEEDALLKGIAGSEDLIGIGTGLSAAEVRSTNWVVATSTNPDKYTRFNIVVVDKKVTLDEDTVDYNERFVFEHAHTRQRLKLSSLLGMENPTSWWEYTGDESLVPDPFKEGSIVDSEVCQFERVEPAEIKDILYGYRFLQLARAATTSLQLTPRSEQLYLPLYRHFHNALLTLTLWTLGIANSDATLWPENTAAAEATRKPTKTSMVMKELASQLGGNSETFAATVASERLANAVQDGLATLGIEGEEQDDADKDGSSMDSDDEKGAGFDYTDSEREDEEELGTGHLDGASDKDGAWGTPVGLQMGLLQPKARYRALDSSDKRNRRKDKSLVHSSTRAPAVEELADRQSALAPWIGRKVPRTDKSSKRTAPRSGIDESPLLKFTNTKLQSFVYKDLPVNEAMLRRQMILADMSFIDHVVHFLNVLFQLQRAASLTHDERMREQFSDVPPLLLACSVQINKLIQACVFKNDKVALKLISVQGSFLAMISQKIQGWEPPIEAILLQTCKEEAHRSNLYGCIGSMESQNEAIVGLNMHSSTEPRSGAGEEEEEEGDGADQQPKADDSFSIEPILVDAISASDIRQVVEQMHELHLKRDPSALKILGLLTLLCSSGRAKKYFQNLLINAIAIQDHEEYSLTGDFIQQLRPSSLQTNCMLFFTQFANKRWEVKFNSDFSFPSQQGKNQEQLRLKLEREGTSLKKLFAYYNVDSNAELDVKESFELLEDLGLGGPFLYKEIRYLESSTVWGFATWWCYRSSFYYPASSISQCQLSPVQAVQVMGQRVTVAMMEMEMKRSMISEQAVAMTLDHVELINARIPGLCIIYEEPRERDPDGLGIVEDYVRSLGGEHDDQFTMKARQASSTHPARRSSRVRGENAPTSPNTIGGTEWTDFSSALDEDYSESAWFRLSLNLLAEVCKDRNAYTQRIVGSILPAECLLAVLEEDSVHFVEKSVLCKLLANVYVDHKLVFPTRFAPFNTDTIYLGYREDVLNPAITMGKLFNAQSRARFQGKGAEDGSELRRRLFHHLSDKISSVQLMSRSRAKIAYIAALLELFKLLIVKGFFQEPEFLFIEPNKTSDDFLETSNSRAPSHAAQSSSAPPGETEGFNMLFVERLMVDKLNNVLLVHQCTTDFEEVSNVDDIIANQHLDAMRGKTVPVKKQFSMRTARRFRRKKRTQIDEHDISKELATKLGRTRKTFDGLRDNFSFFDVLYADNSLADVMRSVIDILTFIHDIRQMLKLTICWNYVVNAKLAITERAYLMDLIDLERFVPRLHMDSFLDALFDGFKCAEVVPGYVAAVFSTTMYDDHDLRRRALELLDRQISPARDAQHMFQHLSLVTNRHKAFIYRLVTVYEDLLLDYVRQIVAQPMPTNAYLLERMTFCIENLRALHFSRFLDRLDASPSEEQRRIKLQRTITGLKKEAKRLNIDSTSFQPDGKPELDCMNYLKQPIACPTGPDDFFQLDLERLIMQEGATDALAAHFDLRFQSADINMPEAVVDCSVTMTRLSAELIDIVLRLTRSPMFFPWHAMYDSEKFLLDQVLSYLAEVGYNSQSLIENWFPLLSDFIISYFPESLGCGKMAISILRNCRSAHLGKDAFSRYILRTIVHHGLVGTSMCSSILCAILECDDLTAVNSAASFMLGRIQDFTCNFNFRTGPEALADNEDLRHQLHGIIRPLSLCFNGSIDVPDSILNALRVPLSASFCYSYLESEDIPLYLKTSIGLLAARLHPFQLVPVESLVLAEVRFMRKIFSVDSGLDTNQSMMHCRDFLFEGLLPVVKQRLLDSCTISCTEINRDVLRVVAYNEDHRCSNVSIAKIVGMKIRAFFPENPTVQTAMNDLPLRREGSEDDLDSMEERSTALLDLSVFQCVMVLLNVLRLRGGFMWKVAHPKQRMDLVFVCTACKLLMSNFPDRIVDPQLREGLKVADFAHIIERLSELVQGMVLEQLARAVEEHIVTFYDGQLVSVGRKQFAATVQMSAEKVLAHKSALQMVQDCFHSDAVGAEKTSFQTSMQLAVVFPVDYLVRTPYFIFLKKCLDDAAAFIDRGGDLLFGDWRTPVVKSRTFASKFSSYTDFELWERGGGRYLQCLLQYLGRVKFPTDAEYNILHLLAALLLHNIEEIRQSTVLSLNFRLALVEAETKRLRRLQMALNGLGAQSLLTIVLGNVYNCAVDAYIWLYAPLVLTFSNEIISWGNRDSQQHTLDTIAFYISKNKSPEMNCLLGLRTMIRRCNLEIAYSSADSATRSVKLKGGYLDSEHTKILRSVKQLFVFVGMFCKGDNLHAQRFFSANLSTSKQYVDLVQELSLLTNAVLTKFTSSIEYMRSTAFHERLGPLVWEAKDPAKRRYLAWHHPSNNILLFTQYMFTIIPMLDGLLSMCCDETFGSIQQALGKCPDILEFSGLMQLQAESLVLSRSLVGLTTGKRPVSWSGGDPFQFYRTYAAHLSTTEIAEGDPENDMIVETLKNWSSLRSKSSSLMGSRTLHMNDFLKVFGVSHKFFQEIARKTEEKCLAMILAFLEVASSASSQQLATKFNDGILMQNMNCTFQKIFDQEDNFMKGLTSATDKYAPTAVAYTSLIESLGNYFPETQELLEDWEETLLRAGRDPKRIYGVVEIIGKNSRLQRLYFPVPTFVSRYWPYPEVQKMKDSIVMTVNRQSPEEKLADFLQQMLRITTVMKRQERLRAFLSFPLHAFFGGKTVTFSHFLPNQRMLALILTLLLNIYYCYFTSMSTRFEPHSGSYLRHWVNWGFSGTMIVVVKAVHLGLNGSLTLSRILNSEVTDDLFQSFQSDSFVLNALLKLAVSPAAAALLVYDTFWPICMLGFSFLAFYLDKFWLYVPCLFDVAFQFTFMNFLYSAVAENGSKIWYTLLLAFLCLYFYAVIATLYFSNQYTLDDHGGCENIVACFKLHLDYGLYNVPNWNNEGYISPELPFPFVYGTLLARVLGTMYNVSYVILINLVLQSIISGLIIDTFSKLREENEAVLQDINDKCFVCSIDRDDFEQAGIPFHQHIREEHNMWHYVWFKVYLESKDPLTYSSSENHSAENLNDTQSFLRLMPIKKSVSLRMKGEQEQDEQVEEKLDALLQAVTKMSLTQAKLTKSVTLLRRANARLESKINQKDSTNAISQATADNNNA